MAHSTLVISRIMSSVNAPPLAHHLLRARDLADSRFAEPLDLEALARAARAWLWASTASARSRPRSAAMWGLRPPSTDAERPSNADRIPLCFVKAWTRLPWDGAFREDNVPRRD
jgi:hypothetical protein